MGLKEINIAVRERMVRPMATQTAATAIAPTFTRAERRMLRALRTRYRQDHDLFSESESAHLRFIRWLYQTGRLVS